MLITGASGGVGSAAVQLAKRRGAAVVAVTSPDKADALRAIGADEIVRREDGIAATIENESIDATYPLHDIATAQADFAAKRFVGKLVLIPPPDPRPDEPAGSIADSTDGSSS